MKNQTYSINLCGKTVELPVIRIADTVSICFFNLHGNATLTEYCAEKLAPLLQGAEVILTAESKGLQLAHCIARNLGHTHYAVARKSKKLYLQDGIQAQVQSITTKEVQTLYLSAHDAALLKGKKVAIVDDVISTGGSLKGLEDLVTLANGQLIHKAAVLAEGDAKNRQDITFLATIPILP